MLAAFPFYAGDAHLLEDLLIWIRDLGGCNGHDAVLVADAAMPWDSVLLLRDLAKASFDSVDITTNEMHVDGWIPGSNSLWLAAAKYAHTHVRPFWFHEPDCIPLKTGWLTALETAWKATCCQPYFGAVVNHSLASQPNPYLEGCAIYHAHAFLALAPTFDMTRSWTLACAAETAKKAVNTPLVHHFWGQNKKPPTFSESKATSDPINTLTLDCICKEAVVFHRNKDCTLIRLLRARMRLPEKDHRPHELILVFPFCGRDGQLAIKTMDWIKELSDQNKMRRTCVLHFDASPDARTVAHIIKSAEDAFDRVFVSRYKNPVPPYVGYPGACNWAFRHAVYYMRDHFSNSWLWLEPDAIPTQSDWLFAIEDEYARGGKPFMGTMFSNMGHLNGVAIYPNNTADYVPSALRAISEPWDMAMMSEVMPNAYCGNAFICHCRSVSNGRCVDVAGSAPVFNSIRDLGLVEPGVRIFHPCKDGGLIKLLRIPK